MLHATAVIRVRRGCRSRRRRACENLVAGCFSSQGLFLQDAYSGGLKCPPAFWSDFSLSPLSNGGNMAIVRDIPDKGTTKNNCMVWLYPSSDVVSFSIRDVLYTLNVHSLSSAFP